jgi:hypothetical protein
MTSSTLKSPPISTLMPALFNPMKASIRLPLFSALCVIAAAPPATAAPIANWTQLNGAVVVPLDGADTDGPTYGDGVTVNSAQSAWVAGLFGTVPSPQSVTLSIGETLTVSGSVVLTGGGPANNQFRFGIFNDGGAFELGSGSGWTGGWMHTIFNDLWQGRTDGAYISTGGNAVPLLRLQHVGHAR